MHLFAISFDWCEVWKEGVFVSSLCNYMGYPFSLRINAPHSYSVFVLNKLK